MADKYIPAGLRADEFRTRLEDKNKLSSKGSLYAGTGNVEQINEKDCYETVATSAPTTTGSILTYTNEGETGLEWKGVLDVVNGAGAVAKAEKAESAVNADNVKLKSGVYKEFATALLEMVYPVGSIKLTVDNTNPSAYLGGAWEAWGAGKVPVGIDTADSDFATAEKSGGSKGNKLTEDNIPIHTHTTMYDDLGVGYARAGLVGAIDAPTSWEKSLTSHCYLGVGSSLDTDTVSIVNAYKPITGSYGVVSIRQKEVSTVQPYITCYMWKRTA